jgi:alpha-mannosidase
MAYNRPILAAQTEAPLPEAQPQLTIEGTDSVVCTALRIAEHSDKLLLRFFETSGQPCQAIISFGRGITSVEEVNFLEHSTGGALEVQDGKVTSNFHPFEVKTLAVTCDGVL